jgi:hypothetical protein
MVAPPQQHKLQFGLQLPRKFQRGFVLEIQILE